MALVLSSTSFAGGGGVEETHCNAKISEDLSALVIIFGSPFFQEVGSGVEVLPDPAPDPSKEYFYSVTDVHKKAAGTQITLADLSGNPLGQQLTILIRNKAPRFNLVVNLPNGGEKTVPMKCEFEP